MSEFSRLSRDFSPINGDKVQQRGSFLLLLFTSVSIPNHTPFPYHELWDLVSARILEYPPFNEVIHWDEATEAKVVLEQPQILESYILMPVFGFSTLDVFKRRLYVRPLQSEDPVSVVTLT